MAPADWGGAKETEEVRSRSLAENGHLMAPADWGGVEEVKESRPLASIPLAIATLLAILGSAAGYPVWPGGNRRTVSATILLPSPGLAAVYGLHSPVWVWAGGCRRMVSATILLPSPGLAAVYGPAHSPVWVWAGGCRRVVSATIYLSSPGLAAVHGLARARSLTPSHPMSLAVSATQLAVTFLVTFASRRTSGLRRTAAGAASAKLMMKSIRRVRVSILCCRIFVGYGT